VDYLNPGRAGVIICVHHPRAKWNGCVIEGKRAVGVELFNDRRQRQTQTVKAGREIVLSGGAINSPQLLMLSGIGEAEQLARARDIEVRKKPARLSAKKLQTTCKARWSYKCNEGRPWNGRGQQP